MSNVVAQLLGVVLRCVLKPKKRKPAPQDSGLRIEDSGMRIAEGSQDLKEGGKE